MMPQKLKWQLVFGRACASVRMNGREYEIYATDNGIVYGLYRYPFKPHYRYPAFVLHEGFKNMKEAKKWADKYTMKELKWKFQNWRIVTKETGII